MAHHRGLHLNPEASSCTCDQGNSWTSAIYQNDSHSHTTTSANGQICQNLYSRPQYYERPSSSQDSKDQGHFQFGMGPSGTIQPKMDPTSYRPHEGMTSFSHLPPDMRPGSFGASRPQFLSQPPFSDEMDKGNSLADPFGKNHIAKKPPRNTEFDIRQYTKSSPILDCDQNNPARQELMGGRSPSLQTWLDIIQAQIRGDKKTSDVEKLLCSRSRFSDISQELKTPGSIRKPDSWPGKPEAWKNHVKSNYILSQELDKGYIFGDMEFKGPRVLHKIKSTKKNETHTPLEDSFNIISAAHFEVATITKSGHTETKHCGRDTTFRRVKQISDSIPKKWVVAFVQNCPHPYCVKNRQKGEGIKATGQKGGPGSKRKIDEISEAGSVEAKSYSTSSAKKLRNSHIFTPQPAETLTPPANEDIFDSEQPVYQLYSSQAEVNFTAPPPISRTGDSSENTLPAVDNGYQQLSRYEFTEERNQPNTFGSSPAGHDSLHNRMGFETQAEVDTGRYIDPALFGASGSASTLPEIPPQSKVLMALPDMQVTLPEMPIALPEMPMGSDSLTIPENLQNGMMQWHAHELDEFFEYDFGNGAGNVEGAEAPNAYSDFGGQSRSVGEVA